MHQLAWNKAPYEQRDDSKPDAPEDAEKHSMLLHKEILAEIVTEIGGAPIESRNPAAFSQRPDAAKKITVPASGQIRREGISPVLRSQIAKRFPGLFSQISSAKS